MQCGRGLQRISFQTQVNFAGIRQPEVLPKQDMDRAPSLASGIGSAAFEWNHGSAQPAQSTASRRSSSAAENITFAPGSSSHASDDQLRTSDARSSDTIGRYNSFNYSDPASAREMADVEMAETEEGHDHSFSPVHGSPPRLPPIRLTPPGHAPAHTHQADHSRSPHTQPPPPTSFPSEAVAARDGVTPENLAQVWSKQKNTRP